MRYDGRYTENATYPPNATAYRMQACQVMDIRALAASRDPSEVVGTLLDRGFLLAHDVKTGKQIYGRQRISVDSSGFTTSPWAYNGKIFLMSEDGDTFVVQAGPEYKLLGKNSLNEMPLATPAVARGSLIVRTYSKMYRIAKEVRP